MARSVAVAMKSTQDSQNHAEIKHLGFLEITVLVLSVYVLGALLVQAIVKLSPEINALLDSLDSLICLVMVAGVGLFGVLTGLFARLFLESEWKSDESDLAKLTMEIRLLREKIEQMEQRQSNQTPRLP